jgi:hypothetical protein
VRLAGQTAEVGFGAGGVGKGAELLLELAFGGDARGREAGDPCGFLRAACGHGEKQNDRRAKGRGDRAIKRTKLSFAHAAYLSGADAKCKDVVLWMAGVQLFIGTNARSRCSRKYTPSHVKIPKVIAKQELNRG